MEIRELEGFADLAVVEELQREVWGMSDMDIVNRHVLRVAIEIGGVVLGAFDGDAMVGFSSGFAAHRKGHREVHSDMLAIREGYRDKGVGYALKMAQRERVLAMGVHRITWTFDPLRSRNAHFNFRKLGVICDEYLVNFYGETTSSFLHNTGTDRLWVTWLLRDPRPAGKEKAHVAVPRAIDALPHAEQLAWRERTRTQFQDLIGAGYIVTDYDGSTGIYTLER